MKVLDLRDEHTQRQWLADLKAAGVPIDPEEEYKLFGLDSWSDAYFKFKDDQDSLHYVSGWRAAAEGYLPPSGATPAHEMGYFDRLGRDKDD